jgi:MarR family transcriptional regulator, organic hydroperoxide resistance regulator
MASRHTRVTGKALTAGTAHSELDFDGLDQLFGYRLRRAQGAVHRDYMATVANLKLTQKQTAVMWLVQANAGVSQGGVGAALGIDRATMMALVDRLESRGLLARRRSRTDARLRELHATAAGEQLLRQVRRRIARHEARMKRLFSIVDLRKFERLLAVLQGLDRT